MPAEPAVPAPAGLEGHLAHLTASLAACWKLRWDNAAKEVWWRLTVQGIPGAGGSDVWGELPCPCGWQCPGREPQGRRLAARVVRVHFFWECPVAQAVVSELQRCLPAGVLLSRAHVWLLQSPAPQVNLGVWRAVCLAALSAMDTGRRCCWKLNKERLERGPRQQSLHEAWGLQGPPAPLHARAGRVAVLQFWSLLEGFAVLHRYPFQWPAGRDLPADHAFLARDEGLPAKPCGLRAIKVVQPAGAG